MTPTKDYALNQRARQMARKPAPPTESRDAPLKLIALGFLAALCGVLMLAALLGVLSRQTADAPTISVNNEAAYLQITLQVSTNTPRPTATPEDTRTPYPSPTASVYVQKVNTSDNNLHTNQATATPYPTYTPYPTLTHYPTSTPLAYTPSSTPNATATQSERDSLIAYQHAKIDLWWERLALVGVGVFVLICLAVLSVIAYRAIRAAIEHQFEDARGATSAEDVQAQHSAVLRSVLDLFDLSIAAHGENGTQLLGWRDIEGIDGEAWTDIVDSIEGAGVPMLRQSGVGTFVKNGTLKSYRLRFELGYLTPSPLSED